jgi:uncharacterized membrane protein YdjX (TVP38/TMEM64 family)
MAGRREQHGCRMVEQAAPKKSSRRWRWMGPITLASILLLVGIWWYMHSDQPLEGLWHLLEQRVNPLLFITLMLILPIFGVPLTPFLLLAGIKFGLVEGTLLSAAAMLGHMVMVYYLVHSFLRRWIIALLHRLHIAVPAQHAPPGWWPAALFMLIPGLPYAVKNTLLALSTMPFGPYLAINWTTQFSLSLPFILFGGAVVEMDYTLLATAFALALCGAVLLSFLKRKFWRSKQERPKSR